MSSTTTTSVTTAALWERACAEEPLLRALETELHRHMADHHTAGEPCSFQHWTAYKRLLTHLVGWDRGQHLASQDPWLRTSAAWDACYQQLLAVTGL